MAAFPYSGCLGQFRQHQLQLLGCGHLLGQGEAAQVLQGFEVGGGRRGGLHRIEAGVAGGKGEHFKHGLQGGEEDGAVGQTVVIEQLLGGVEINAAGAVGAVVDGINPGFGAIGGAELALGGPGGAVPEDQVAALLLGQYAHLHGPH